MTEEGEVIWMNLCDEKNREPVQILQFTITIFFGQRFWYSVVITKADHNFNIGPREASSPKGMSASTHLKNNCFDITFYCSIRKTVVKSATLLNSPLAQFGTKLKTHLGHHENIFKKWHFQLVWWQLLLMKGIQWWSKKNRWKYKKSEFDFF